MKKNNYLLPFSILFALGIANNSYGQEPLKGEATETKAAITPSFLALEGRILDADNNAVSFATVLLKGTNKVIQADANGNYRFNELQAGTYIILVSCEGYETFEMTLTIDKVKTVSGNKHNYRTPNNKSINNSPVIKDMVLKQLSV